MNSLVALIFLFVSTLAFEYDYYGSDSYDYGDGNNYDFEYDPSKYEIKHTLILGSEQTFAISTLEYDVTQRLFLTCFLTCQTSLWV